MSRKRRQRKKERGEGSVLEVEDDIKKYTDFESPPWGCNYGLPQLLRPSFHKGSSPTTSEVIAQRDDSR